LPAYRSANETTFICAKPNVSSTLGDTSRSSGSKTQPLITGVTSILICASPFWTVSLVTIFSRALTTSVTRAPGNPFLMAAAMRFIAASIAARDLWRGATGR
jgi:hypothetical protein